MTVGIDGGFVRAARKEGWFEVIAGKSVVAFRREENDQTPSAKCFGFVQTYDEKPRRRLWELLKSQGMQENQQVVFLSDGGDTVRQPQEYLHPCSEHLIDWFHITMRLTVLQQQAKGLQAEQPQFGQETSKQLESVKHLLWHGNTEEALERIGGLNIELDLLRAFSPPADKLGKNLGEFETYIRNNIEFIPNAQTCGGELGSSSAAPVISPGPRSFRILLPSVFGCVVSLWLATPSVRSI